MEAGLGKEKKLTFQHTLGRLVAVSTRGQALQIRGAFCLPPHAALVFHEGSTRAVHPVGLSVPVRDVRGHWAHNS